LCDGSQRGHSEREESDHHDYVLVKSAPEVMVEMHAIHIPATEGGWGVERAFTVRVNGATLYVHAKHSGVPTRKSDHR
jgi:hypothetical protein